MASNPKFPDKNRPVRSVPAKAAPPDVVTAEAAEQRIEPAPVTVELKEPSVIQAANAPVAAPLPEATIPDVAISDVTTSSVASTGAFDFGALPLKTLDLFNENTAALIDFAAELGKVKSVTDVVSLQSRFASECYATFLRQSNEIADLTRKMAVGAVAFRYGRGALAT